jgi:hypothetical protein
VGAQFFERRLGHPFYRGQRSHRHKYGGLDFSVGSKQATGAGSAVSGIDVECDGHFVDCSNGSTYGIGNFAYLCRRKRGKGLPGPAQGIWVVKSVI